MPLSIPVDGLDPSQFDQLLAAGYRRAGYFFYRTRCPACSACEPLRLDVAVFTPSRSQRRVQKLGTRHLRVQVSEPTIDARRIELFNRHRQERRLDHGDAPAQAADYSAFLLSSQCQTTELSLWADEKLVAVSITDLGDCSLSAVYCFFDPDYAWLSPGTFAILQQVELARQTNRRWLYLGMFVEENYHLRYKARFAPHQRRIAGIWQDFPQNSQIH